MSIKIVVCGAAGRMGQALVRSLAAGVVKDLQLAGALEAAGHARLGQDAGTISGGQALGIPLTADLAQAAAGAQVLIDFSARTATAAHAAWAAGHGKGMVIGTTGLEDAETAAVRDAARSIPVVLAPNMSLGVNLLFALLRQAARALKDKGYDVEIVERHHRRKKDSPSGTALGLGRAVAAGFDWDLEQVAAHGRAGVAPGDRPVRQIGFHAVRGGDIVGDHTVLFAADGECLEFSHRLTSRDTLAVGALRAAAWVAGRDPGMYSMQDVLGLQS